MIMFQYLIGLMMISLTNGFQVLYTARDNVCNLPSIDEVCLISSRLDKCCETVVSKDPVCLEVDKLKNTTKSDVCVLLGGFNDICCK